MTPHAIGPPGTSRTSLWVACLAVVLFKLWLVGGEEIVANPFSPLDDLAYARYAQEGYWFGGFELGAFDVPPFARAPAYPLFLAAVAQTGIPLRLAIELLLALSAAGLAAALVAAGQPRWIGPALFGLIVLHPLNIDVDRHIGTDMFYGPMLWLALAALIVSRREQPPRARLGWALLAGVALAVADQTRAERVLILVLLALYVALEGLRRPALRRWGPAALAAGLVVFVAGLGVRSANYVHFGVFAPETLASPRFGSALRALVRIEPERYERHVQLTRDALAKGFAVSPALRELQPLLDGGFGREWESYGLEEGLSGRGFAGSYLVWMLTLAARRIGYDGPPARAEAYWERVAAEIDAACDDHRLPCRFVLSGRLDPHTTGYLPYLGPSLFKLSSLLLRPTAPLREIDLPEAPPTGRAFIDAAANRRSALSSPPRGVRLEGWALDGSRPPQRITLVGPNAETLGSTAPRLPCPDSRVAERCGFELTAPFALAAGSAAGVSFTTAAGRDWFVPLVVGERSGPSTHGTLAYDVGTTLVERQPFARQQRMQRALTAAYAVLYPLLAAAGLAAGGLLVLRRAASLRDPLFAAVALLVGTIVARLALLTLVDAAWFPADEPRYVYPAVPLLACAALPLVERALRLVFRPRA